MAKRTYPASSGNGSLHASVDRAVLEELRRINRAIDDVSGADAAWRDVRRKPGPLNAHVRDAAEDGRALLRLADRLSPDDRRRIALEIIEAIHGLAETQTAVPVSRRILAVSVKEQIAPQRYIADQLGLDERDVRRLDAAKLPKLPQATAKLLKRNWKSVFVPVARLAAI